MVTISDRLAERRLRRGGSPAHVAVVFGETVESTSVRDFYVWCDEFGVETATACVPDADEETRRRLEESLEDLEPPVLATDGNERVEEGAGGRVLSYVGGRDETVGALRRLAEDVESGEVDADEIGFKEVEERLTVPGEPDLVLDVTDDHLSDVLVWQTVYSELCHIDVFDRSTFVRCLDDYRERERRFGR
ncbi:MAG: undecaprenyl diphosphate synthase family protein [Halobacteriales archaeon]|nr:undecaprenyl diphosphate synthase family protein [Halobacteriales archaeon]